MSKNEIRSGETVISSEPSIDSKAKKSSRQEGILNRVRQHWANLTSAAGLLSMALVSPIDLPRGPIAEEKPAAANTVTVLHGDSDINDIRVLILAADPNTPFSILQEAAEDLFVIEPTDQFKEKTTVVAKYPSRSLNCDKNTGENCNLDDIHAETDKVVASGIPVHGVLVVKESDGLYGNGRSYVSPRTDVPSNRYPSIVIRPTGLSAWARKGFAAMETHEFWWHQVAGQGHPNRGDAVSVPIGGDFLHPDSARELLDVMKNRPHGFYNPSLKYNLGGGMSLQSPERPIPLPSMELNLPKADIPAGTRWLKVFIRQEDGPAVGLIIGDPNAINQFREGKYNIEAPDMATGKSFILLKDQLVTASLWGSDAQGMPEWQSKLWTEHNAWPELVVPSSEAKIVFRTPPSTTIIGSATESRTTDRTPTIKWSSSDKTAFYYEVQLSGDTRFDPNPDSATSFVYWNLVHGGVTEPRNSWTVPDNAALAPGKYFYRVRERVQGSGTEAKWSPAFQIEITSAMAQAMTESQQNIANREDDCIADFFHQGPKPIGPNDLLDPSCYTLMGDRVTLKPGNISIRGFDKENAYIPNRQERRKQAREARKNTYRAA